MPVKRSRKVAGSILIRTWITASNRLTIRQCKDASTTQEGDHLDDLHDEKTCQWSSGLNECGQETAIRWRADFKVRRRDECR